MNPSITLFFGRSERNFSGGVLYYHLKPLIGKKLIPSLLDFYLKDYTMIFKNLGLNYGSYVYILFLFFYLTLFRTYSDFYLFML